VRGLPILELFDDVCGRWQIGITHAEVDDIGAVVTSRGFGAIDGLEYVRRQPANAIEFFHG
jgi:hypothetical protein